MTVGFVKTPALRFATCKLTLKSLLAWIHPCVGLVMTVETMFVVAGISPIAEEDMSDWFDT